MIYKKSKYSPLEAKILALIPEDGRKINTIELANQVYEPGKFPTFPRQTVLHIANRLIQKSDLYEESWEIFKSPPRGSQPVYFWREERRR
jgi:hypothetical protein